MTNTTTGKPNKKNSRRFGRFLCEYWVFQAFAKDYGKKETEKTKPQKSEEQTKTNKKKRQASPGNVGVQSYDKIGQNQRTEMYAANA